MKDEFPLPLSYWLYYYFFLFETCYGRNNILTRLTISVCYIAMYNNTIYVPLKRKTLKYFARIYLLPCHW